MELYGLDFGSSQPGLRFFSTLLETFAMARPAAGQTPLFLACCSGHSEVVRCLIQTLVPRSETAVSVGSGNENDGIVVNGRQCMYSTLWLLNIAMGNGPFIDGLPGFTWVYLLKMVIFHGYVK